MKKAPYGWPGSRKSFEAEQAAVEAQLIMALAKAAHYDISLRRIMEIVNESRENG
jgi:hypothetical protein